MTAPEATVDEPVDLPLTPEEMENLETAIGLNSTVQPTMHLLDVENAEWHGAEGTAHRMTIDSIPGVFDTTTALFTPDDPEPVRQLLVARLADTHGETPFDVAGTPRVVDWESLWLVEEGDGRIVAGASSVSEEDPVEITLTIDVEFGVTVTEGTPPEPADAEQDTEESTEESTEDDTEEQTEEDTEDTAEDTAEEATDQAAAEPTAPRPTAANQAPATPTTATQAPAKASPSTASPPKDSPPKAEPPKTEPPKAEPPKAEPPKADGPAEEEEDGPITAEDLENAYGDLWFEFEGQSFQIHWREWDPDGDELTSDLTGNDADGTDHRMRVVVDLEVGPVIESAEPMTEDTDEDEEDDEITAEDLADNYGDSLFEHGDQAFLVDWSAWEPDNRTDDGLIGSPLPATAEDGSRWRLYVWFDPDEGPRIDEAELLEEAAAADTPEEVDPEQAARIRFDEEICQELMNRWSSDGKVFTDAGGTTYDVSSWVDGGFDGSFEFAGYDDDHVYATLGAATLDDEPRQVVLHLRIANADAVWVEREESR